MTDHVGQRFGNYRLVHLLGEGGFASVYLGQHVRISTQQAAIKILHTHVTGANIQQFQREAETIAALAHPNIVRLLDFDVQNDTSFLAMDYAPNGSLRNRHPQGQQVPLATIQTYIRQLADALSYAHSQHVVHRDIKPENMLVGKRGEILLSDFGIAVISQTGYTTLQTGQNVGGTACYMAPEQFRGIARSASDQYALAIVVYEWLCGYPPFMQGDFIQLGYQHSHEQPPSLRARVPSISPALEQVVFKALAKDPLQRFSNVHEFARALIEVSKPHGTPIGTPVITYRGHANWIHALAWSPDGTHIASASADHTVQIWEVNSGRPKLFYNGHSDVVWCVAWSPDGTRLATGSRDHTVQVWDAQTGNRLATLQGHRADVLSVAWSPDSTRLLSASWDHKIFVWDIAQSRQLLTYTGHNDIAWSVAWSPNGARVVSASEDKSAQVWNATTGQRIFSYQGHTNKVITVAWSPDGTRIASGSDDKTVQVWNAATGQRIFTYAGHSDEVWCVAWSPDSTLLASSSRDKTVQVWDTQTGRQLYSYRGHNSEINTAAWSPDGTRIASGAFDNTVQVWQGIAPV